jgi:pyruvate dehydrogenase E2 component (dihydrolipoamide acetyltransferase)
MIVRASALALMKVPEVNRAYRDESYFQPAAAHVGIAVAIEDGLIVPVVKDANTKSLRTLARESRELIDKARTRRLQPAEYSGGTFTVSNLGSFDVESFGAIIDPSQGAILAVASMRKIPVVLANDTIAVRQRMNVTLSGDHRVMDGATGARFLQELKRLLQNPLLLLDV